MTRRLTQAQMARFLAYCNRELLRDDLPDERRQVLEGKAEFYRSHLRNTCMRCGRPIEAPESIASGLGSTCRQHEAVPA